MLSHGYIITCDQKQLMCDYLLHHESRPEEQDSSSDRTGYKGGWGYQRTSQILQSRGANPSPREP